MGSTKEKSKCKGCGKCCYNVPLPKSYFSAFRNKIITPFTTAVGLGDLPKLGKDIIIPETKDGICPFLTKKNTCNIYDKRPWICRNFGSSEEPILKCYILEGKEIKEQRNIMSDIIGALRLLQKEGLKYG